MPLPAATNIEAIIDLVVTRASEAYGEDAGQIKFALIGSLTKSAIEINQIYEIEYSGARESLPPQHVFKVTTRNGVVNEVAAVASPGRSLPVTTVAEDPPAPKRMPSRGPIPAPPVTTMPLPALGDAEATLKTVVGLTANAYGESADKIMSALRADFDKLNQADISAIRYAGAQESYPPTLLIKITLCNGRSTVLRATIPLER